MLLGWLDNQRFLSNPSPATNASSCCQTNSKSSSAAYSSPLRLYSAFVFSQYLLLSPVLILILKAFNNSFSLKFFRAENVQYVKLEHPMITPHIAKEIVSASIILQPRPLWWRASLGYKGMVCQKRCWEFVACCSLV